MNGLSLNHTKIEGNLYGTLEKYLGKSPRDLPTHVLRKFTDVKTITGIAAAVSLNVQHTNRGITSADNTHQAEIFYPGLGTSIKLGDAVSADTNFSATAGDIMICSALAVSTGSSDNDPKGVATGAIIPEASLNVNGTTTSGDIISKRINSTQQVVESLGKADALVVRDVYVQRDDRHSGATKVISVEGLTDGSVTTIVLTTYVLQRIDATGTSVAFESVVDKDFIYNAVISGYESHGCLSIKS